MKSDFLERVEMPKLVTNVEGTEVKVGEMRVQMQQMLERLNADQIVTFAFRMTIGEYQPRETDAKP